MRQESHLTRELSPAAPPAATGGLGGQRGLLVAARELHRSASPLALCFVVLTMGSTYRKAGALAAVVAADGTQHGVISGGCLEPELAAAAHRVLAAREPGIAVFDTQSDRDLIFGSGSGCRGRTTVLLVPIPSGAPALLLEALERADEARLPATLAVATDGPRAGSGWCWWSTEAVPIGDAPPDLSDLRQRPTGAHPLRPGETSAACAVTVIQPLPRLIVVGAGPELPPLIRIGREMGWHVSVIDHRAAAVATYAAHADVAIVSRPASGLARLNGHPRDAVVVMTHTAANDLEALRTLAARPERYIGLLGPRARRDELMGELGPDERGRLIERLHSPVGIKLGGDGPEVLALSIAAEIQQFLTTRE